MSILATNLRLSPHRQPSRAEDGAGKLLVRRKHRRSPAQTAASLRARHWVLQQKAGMDHIPSNDFSLYDQMLDTIAMLGAVPPRFGHKGGPVGLDLYFAMARGRQDAPAMEMTKWFDTNYHYIVPELTADTQFALSTTKAVDEFKEAKFLGITTRPVLIGPVTFLKLAKMRDGADRWALLPRFFPSTGRCSRPWAKPARNGCRSMSRFWFPISTMPRAMLCNDAYCEADRRAARSCSPPISARSATTPRPWWRCRWPACIWIWCARPSSWPMCAKALPKERILSLGLINGRNIWKTALTDGERLIDQAQRLHGDRLFIGPSCSLLHFPVDLDTETKLDAELRGWLAFATQKLTEIRALADAANGARDGDYFRENAQAVGSRVTSPRIHDPAVKQRVAAVTPQMAAAQDAVQGPHRASAIPVEAAAAAHHQHRLSAADTGNPRIARRLQERRLGQGLLRKAA